MRVNGFKLAKKSREEWGEYVQAIVIAGQASGILLDGRSAGRKEIFGSLSCLQVTHACLLIFG